MAEYNQYRSDSSDKSLKSIKSIDNENDGNESGEALLSEPGDVADIGADIESHNDQKDDGNPPADPDSEGKILPAHSLAEVKDN